MRPLPIEALEAAPPFVIGVAVIRGEAVAVVALARLFGEASTSAGRFVTVDTGRHRVALAVDQVIGVREIESEAASQLPPLLHDLPELIATLGTLDSELLVILNAARLLPTDVIVGATVRGNE